MPINLSLNSTHQIPDYGFGRAFAQGFQLMESVRRRKLDEKIAETNAEIARHQIDTTADTADEDRELGYKKLKSNDRQFDLGLVQQGERDAVDAEVRRGELALGIKEFLLSGELGRRSLLNQETGTENTRVYQEGQLGLGRDELNEKRRSSKVYERYEGKKINNQDTQFNKTFNEAIRTFDETISLKRYEEDADNDYRDQVMFNERTDTALRNLYEAKTFANAQEDRITGNRREAEKHIQETEGRKQAIKAGNFDLSVKEIQTKVATSALEDELNAADSFKLGNAIDQRSALLYSKRPTKDALFTKEKFEENQGIGIKSLESSNEYIVNTISETEAMLEAVMSDPTGQLTASMPHIGTAVSGALITAQNNLQQLERIRPYSDAIEILAGDRDGAMVGAVDNFLGIDNLLPGQGSGDSFFAKHTRGLNPFGQIVTNKQNKVAAQREALSHATRIQAAQNQITRLEEMSNQISVFNSKSAAEQVEDRLAGLTLDFLNTEGFENADPEDLTHELAKKYKVGQENN